jgi:arylsulfatase A-like enzyme
LIILLIAVGALVRLAGHAETAKAQGVVGRNVLIFVADGMRAGSINPTDTPTMYALRQHGVNFTNSHALFPTFTMPNGSAIATGHAMGDTGAFSNTIVPGYQLTLPTPNFSPATGITPSITPTPFIESDPVLGDLDVHYQGNVLSEESLLSTLRRRGYNTASIGKVGPALVQDVTQGMPVGGTVPTPMTVIIDDSTGRPGGVPLLQAVANLLTSTGVGTVCPTRGANGNSGTNTTPGTTVANTDQQQYFADATTRAVLPAFAQNGSPFALVYWSRDPDGTQHNQGDSLNTLVPGINGPTSKASVRNADNNLTQIINYLAASGQLANTDIFVTADHGFGTISHSVVDVNNTLTTSWSATQSYPGVNAGFLPAGFVAIDLAHDLGLSLYDPNTPLPNATNPTSFARVDATQGQRPASGNGLIGGTGQVTPFDARIIVAANGGSDLIYLTTPDPSLLQQVVASMLGKDYVSGLFVDDIYGQVPGTLPLSAINLKGATNMPNPAVVVNFRTFSTDALNPNMTGVELADSTLQQGQGMHGSFGRHDTFNNMIATGPDFKRAFVDPNPVSNADIVPTIAFALGLTIPSRGSLVGRVATEALAGGPQQNLMSSGVLYSAPGANGTRTWVALQLLDNSRYFDAAGFPGKTVGLPVLGGTSAGETLTAGATYLGLDALGGNDTLIGGPNRVTMLGGAGADRFVIAPGNGVSTIGDFSRSEGDKIALATGLTYSSLVFQAGTGPNLGSTVIYQGRTRLIAVVVGVPPSGLFANDFVTYP